jgi:CRP-like cAMP-binding protein
MYILIRGEVEALDEAGRVLGTLADGDCFGEVALLINTPRMATIRARTGCDLVTLDRGSFRRILRDYPHFAEFVLQTARERYDLNIPMETLTSDRAPH